MYIFRLIPTVNKRLADSTTLLLTFTGVIGGCGRLNHAVLLRVSHKPLMHGGVAPWRSAGERLSRPRIA